MADQIESRVDEDGERSNQQGYGIEEPNQLEGEEGGDEKEDEEIVFQRLPPKSLSPSYCR